MLEFHAVTKPLSQVLYLLQEANVMLGQTMRSSALPQQREVAERWGAVVFIALRK
jgi:hypothetical protein